MLLITIIGLSHEMKGRDFVNLENNIIGAIDGALGEKEINEKQIKVFIPGSRVEPGWKGEAIFIYLSGFYTQWVASGSWPDEKMGGLITQEIEASAKKCLGKFSENVTVQCSISSESCIVVG